MLGLPSSSKANRHNISKGTLVCLFLCLSLGGCSSAYYGKGKALLEKQDYDKAIENLYHAATQNPKKADNWRELGIAFYKKGGLDKALEYLKQANRIRPDHKTIFYVGLIYEQRQELDSAVNAYKGYLLLKSKSEMSERVKARLIIVMEKKIGEEAHKALVEEQSINSAKIPTNTAAVTYFNTSALDSSLAVLGKGLAEFLTTDLSKVKQLKIVERSRLQRILEELEFSRTKYVDQSTAPRIGKLLGAHQLITGSILGADTKHLRIDAGLILTGTGEINLTPEVTGTIDQFFALEKALTFRIIEKMGIELTPEEKDAIQKIPTKSFSALLAYCRGLDYLDRGMYPEAQTEFRKASSEDPKFQEALDQKVFLEHKGSVENLSNFEMAFEKTDKEERTTSIALGERLSQTNENSSLIQDLSKDNPNTQAFGSQTGTVIIKGDLHKK